jgi:hypothetical protein
VVLLIGIRFVGFRCHDRSPCLVILDLTQLTYRVARANPNTDPVLLLQNTATQSLMNTDINASPNVQQLTYND